MRSIKFRAWDIKEKKMIKVSQLWFSENNIAGILDEQHDFSHAKEIKIMKFTGFKDCENKDIYVGDILASRLEGDIDKAYIVEWSQSVGAFWVNDTLLSRHLHNEQCGLKYKQAPKIVGNIYENEIGDFK